MTLSRIAPYLYAALLALAVPWYWPAADRTIWFGVPAWVVVAVLVALAAAVLTAVLLAAPWPQEHEAHDE